MRRPDWLQNVEQKLSTGMRLLLWTGAMLLLANCAPGSSQASTVEKYLILEASAGPTVDNGDYLFNVTAKVQSPVDGLDVNFNINGVPASQDIKKGNNRFQVKTGKISNDPQDHVVTIFTASVPGLSCTPDQNPAPNIVKISCLVNP